MTEPQQRRNRAVFLTLSFSLFAPDASAADFDFDKPSNRGLLAKLSYQVYAEYLAEPEITFQEITSRDFAREHDLTRADIERLIEEVDYGTVLMYAINEDNPTVIEKMINRGDVDSEELDAAQAHHFSDEGKPYNDVPLHTATLKAGRPDNFPNSLEILKLLLEAGADPNIVAETRFSTYGSWDDRTPIYMALEYGRTTEPLELLIEHGADVNYSSTYLGYDDVMAIFHAPVTPLAFVRGNVRDPNLHKVEYLSAEKEKILLHAGAKQQTSLAWSVFICEIALSISALAVFAVARAKVPYLVFLFGAHFVLVPYFLLDSDSSMFIQQLTGEEVTYFGLFASQFAFLVLVGYAVSTGVNCFCTSWLAYWIKSRVNPDTTAVHPNPD